MTSSLPQLFLKSSFYETEQEINFTISAFSCYFKNSNFQSQPSFSYRVDPIKLNTTKYQNLSFCFISPGELTYPIEVSFPFCSNIKIQQDPSSEENIIISFSIDRNHFKSTSKELPSFNQTITWEDFKIALKELSKTLNEAGSLITAIELYQDESAINLFHEYFSKIDALKMLKFDFITLLNIPHESPNPIKEGTFLNPCPFSNNKKSSALKKTIFSSIERSLEKFSKNQ